MLSSIDTFYFSHIVIPLLQAQDRVNLKQEKTPFEQPAIFIGHGSPMVAIEYDKWSEDLCDFVDRFPPPKGIIVVSAHWETEDVIKITSSPMPEQIYDFFGFPETLYSLTYPCDGNPELANDIQILLDDLQIDIILDSKRGIDHGVWIPLYVAFPNADIPVVQISIPRISHPKKLLDLGTALSSLRKQGILLIGSGNVVHNLNKVDSDKYAEPEPWAEEADSWISDRLKENDIQALLNFREEVPNKELAFPTDEHFLPLLFTLGAMTQRDHYHAFHEGFHYGNISMRSFAFIQNR